MNFVSLRCPDCGQTLTVSAHAPPRITCPRCLTPINNPATGDVEPVPVIPLDATANFDQRQGRLLLIVVGVLLVGGLLLLAKSAGGAERMLAVDAAIILVLALLVFSMLFLPPSADGRSPVGARPRRIANGSSGFGAVARGCGQVLLILAGVVLLLFGLCAVVIVAAGH